MSEREDQFNRGSGWRLRKDPRMWYGIALFTALGSLLIAIVIGLRVHSGPPIFSPSESQRSPRAAPSTVKSKPADELRRIAITEVKKREGWSGKARGPTPQEGSECSVLVERDPENPEGQSVHVLLERVTGTIVDYRKEERNAADAAKAWKDLLRAMAARDEKRMRQLTTRSGFESLEKGAEGEDKMKVFERWGKGWQKWATRWQHSDALDRIECSLGPEIKAHLLVFKKTAEGWKLDEWTPGE